MRGGDLKVAAQANVQIDADIGQKDHFRQEISKRVAYLQTQKPLPTLRSRPGRCSHFDDNPPAPGDAGTGSREIRADQASAGFPHLQQTQKLLDKTRPFPLEMPL